MICMPSLFRCVCVFSLLAMAAGSQANDKTILGLHEKALLPGLDIEVPAKLDTGADTASLSAHNIKVFEREDAKWVRFELDRVDLDPDLDSADSQVADDSRRTVIEQPLKRLSKIKRRADDRHAGVALRYTVRPVIEMDVCVGNDLQRIEMNLTDRSSFKYPLLIGAKALKEFNAAVDPSARFAAGSPRCSG